jgi:hypothetical protein
LSSSIPSGFRVYIDPGSIPHITNRERIAVLRTVGDATEVWSARAQGWLPIPPGEVLPEGAWTLDALKPVVRALYEALRTYYGEGDLETVKSLTDARNEAQAGRARLEQALIEIATTAAARPSAPWPPAMKPAGVLRDLTRDDLMREQSQRPERITFEGRAGELPREAFEGLPDGQTPRGL